MKVIILAAGQGKRLNNYTKGKPKCLLPLGNETVLSRQLKILKECGFEEKDIFVVGGYRYEDILSVTTNVIVNSYYDITDNSYSLGLALQRVPKDSILVLDGDLVFDKEVILDITEDSRQNIILTKKNNDLEESTGIILNPEGYITEIGKHVKNSGYVYISIFKFSEDVIDDFKEKLLNKDKKNCWYTAPLTEIMNKHRFVNKTTAHKWHEIDFIEDYIDTKKMFCLEE